MPSLEGCDGVAGDLGAYQVVWAELGSPSIVNTLIHESVHVKQHILSYIGEEEVGKELEAYMVAYIAETLIAEYNRQAKEYNALHEEREAGLQT